MCPAVCQTLQECENSEGLDQSSKTDVFQGLILTHPDLTAPRWTALSIGIAYLVASTVLSSILVFLG
jgi:hypothetical protein